MKPTTKGLLLLVSLGALTSVVYGLKHYSFLTPSKMLPQPTDTPKASPPTPHYPVAPEKEETTASSKGVAKTIGGGERTPALTPEEAVSGLLGKEGFEALFIGNDIIKRTVVAVENLDGHMQPTEDLSPFRPLEPNFIVKGTGEDLSIDPRNFERYHAYVELADSIDARKLVRIYRHYYSLFQAAYADLGMQGYFNDRLVEVIDNLLATPRVKGQIKLIRPSLHSKYKYADDQLEGLSSGQKILVRMGDDNAQVVKLKLRQIRSLLVHLGHSKGSHAKS